jgi:hypothetical protein
MQGVIVDINGKESKMRKYLVLFGIFLMGALLLSCNSPKTKAIGYNDKIVGLQSKIMRSMIDFSKTFSAKDTALIEEKYTELLDSIDFALRGAEAMPPFNGSSEFRDVAIRLFEFYDDVAKNEYEEVVEIFYQDEITQDDAKRIQELARDISEREETLDYNFAMVQKAFAKKHGILLRDNKLQREIDRM